MRPSLLRKTVLLLTLLLSLLARASAYAAVVRVPGHHAVCHLPGYDATKELWPPSVRELFPVESAAGISFSNLRYLGPGMGYWSKSFCVPRMQGQ